MKRALLNHVKDVAAMLGMLLIAVGVGGYILSNQRLRFPLLEDKPFPVWVELPSASGVTPGQGQTVRVAGMRVGDVGKVELEDGRARVRLDLETEHSDLIRRDATVLLRPRTGLKDMFLALEPGTAGAPAIGRDGVVRIGNTLPDVNADEILSQLDRDTRDYLKLLLNGAGGGLRGRGGDLQQVFARLGPLHRDLRAINGEVVKRKRNLARLVSNYGKTVERLGKEDRALAELVSSSSRVFSRLGREEGRISQAVERLPGALGQTERTLGRVQELGEVAAPAFEALRPAVRQLDRTNAELRPLAEVGEPVLRTQVRPLARAARPFLADVRPAARDLRRASPDLRESLFELNRFFNMASYNPRGAEGISGDPAVDLKRDEGFLHWVAWTAHNSNSLLSTSDASGPFRRAIVAASCTTTLGLLTAAGPAGPLLGQLLGVQDVLGDPTLCPPS